MDSKKVLISTLVASLVAVLSILTLIIVNKNDEIEIKFDSMSASGVETIKVDKNNKIVKPKDPVREGYTFLGWFNGDEEWNFDTVITEPITLTAKWEKNEEGDSKNVTVTFVSDNGDIIQTQSVKEGDLIVKPKDPVREGYTFIGWFNGNEEWDFSNEVIANISITAKFEKDELTSGNNQGKTFKVTFNSNGGSSVKAQNVKEGNKISKPNNPTRSGYTFTGWLLNGKTYNFNSTVTKNITLVASWKVNPKKYVVTFDSNGGSKVSSQTIEENKTATKPTNPTRPGYKFLGWTYNGGDYNFSSKVTKDIKLVAKWEEIIVYEVKAELIDPSDPFTPEIKVIVYRNGVPIKASELYGDNNLIGKYVAAIDAIRVNKHEFNNSKTFKVKLNDNSVVEASKK